MTKEKLSIGIIGTRGIPNRYGGFEAFAQKLAPWLFKHGHEVSVYCSHLQKEEGEEWKGVKLIYQNNPEDKMGTAGQFIYDMNCNLDARKRNFDILLHLGYTSDSIWWWLWTSKAKHITNMDGMEWWRSKYSKITKKFLQKAEKWAAKNSDSLIADSKGVQDYLLETYDLESAFIPYGAAIPKLSKGQYLKEYKLESQRYDLVLARMEPENNIELAIQAKLQSEDTTPLVIIGNENAYGSALKEKYQNEDKIQFCKADYRQNAMDALRQHARYYVHGHSVGGTNPSLLEAMACECNILAHNNPFNDSVLGDSAKYFSTVEKLADFFSQQNPLCISYQQVQDNLEKIKKDYQWKHICQQYEKAFYDIL